MPLVLTRKEGQRIIIGDDIVIKVAEIFTNNWGNLQVKLVIDAPKETKIYREEIYPKDS